MDSAALLLLLCVVCTSGVACTHVQGNCTHTTTITTTTSCGEGGQGTNVRSILGSQH
jgi:hypothetical protein